VRIHFTFRPQMQTELSQEPSASDKAASLQTGSWFFRDGAKS
jgi:hypothetical protein